MVHKANTAFEEHLAHHDAAIDDISREMADQWKTLQGLERKLDQVIEYIRAMKEDAQSDSPDAPPPHY